MEALRLVYCLIRVPRLFVTLFLFPILLSLFVVLCQVITTGVFFDFVKSEKAQMTSPKDKSGPPQDVNILRLFLYGESHARPPYRICRWVSDTQSSKQTSSAERPPNEECKPDRFDVAIRVPDPATFDASSFDVMFQGNVDRLHICKRCRPDVVFNINPTGTIADTHSVYGLMLVALLIRNETVLQQLEQVRDTHRKVYDIIGKIRFFAPDLRQPIVMSDLVASTPVAFNAALIVVIALWLALKAHRKILDYLARNGALLPLVAATGQRTFYSAVWILTLLRVAAFLCSSIPIVVLSLRFYLEQYQSDLTLFEGPFWVVELALWLAAVSTSLGLATLLGSLADLKHRHFIFSFLYRYVALCICLVGILLWFGSFLFPYVPIAYFRQALAILPLAGVGPVLMGMVFKLPLWILLVHTILSIGLISVLLRHNARWFAAHLEEL